MLFLDTVNQPAPVRTAVYTLTLGGVTPETVQNGGVQGEHRATRLKFILDNSMKSWFESLLLKGRVFCRADVCDGSGKVHQSLPVELSGEFSAYSTLYYGRRR